ncbi:MAG: DUF192 domain-containing protein [Candidatus Riflebacteria bacterium]|nr:DUF192 domain-containing protein [Candidatus Riflebacteria bacterium]
MEHARSFLTRFKGLLFRAGIPADHALVLWKTKSIHMFGMLFSIDVIFLDEGKKVLALFPDRCPFSFPVGSWSARFAVEFRARR